MRIKLIAVLLLALQLSSCKKEVDYDRYFHSSYRFHLWKELELNNWRFDFMGTRKDNSQYPGLFQYVFDRDHQGTAGMQTTGIIENMDFVLFQIGIPDIVLMGIGGNDLLKGKSVPHIISNIETIIKKLQLYNPDVVVFLEQIAPAKPNNSNQTLLKSLDLFNSEIKTLCTNMSNGKSKVIAVDMYSNWQESYFSDDIHYNVLGAREVATNYFNSITSNLSPNKYYKILPIGDSRVEGNQP